MGGGETWMLTVERGAAYERTDERGAFLLAQNEAAQRAAAQQTSQQRARVARAVRGACAARSARAHLDE